MNDCTIVGNGGGSETVDFIKERMFDHWIVNNNFEAMKGLKGIVTGYYAGNYYGGGGEKKVVEFSGSSSSFPAKGNRFMGDFFDNPNNANNAESGCLVCDDYFRGNYIASTFGRNSTSSTADVSPQLLVMGNSMRNMFISHWAHPNAVTNTFKYAIQETESADYNVYMGTINTLDPHGNAVYGTGNTSIAANSDEAHVVAI